MRYFILVLALLGLVFVLCVNINIGFSSSAAFLGLVCEVLAVVLGAWGVLE